MGKRKNPKTAVTEEVAPTPAEVPYLSPGDSTGYLLRYTHLAVTQYMRQRLRRHGLTSAQWWFIRALWMHEPLSQRDLSAAAGTTEATTTMAIRVMEKHGLVRRQRSARGGRAMEVYLTERGRELHQAIMPFAFEVNEVATRGIPPDDIATVHRVMKQIRRNVIERRMNGEVDEAFEPDLD